MIEVIVFAVAGAACLAGAVGVILFRNPVHAALMLVMTLFGVAVLFVAQQAHFIAAVQVIVYAGAIVVLFLFVIMLLGVDRAAELRLDALGAQRWTAAVFGFGGVAIVAWLVTAIDQIFRGLGSYCAEEAATFARSTLPSSSSVVCYNLPSAGVPEGSASSYLIDVSAIARSLFSDYVYAFELTSLLLIVAVIATVMLSRQGGSSLGQPNLGQPSLGGDSPVQRPQQQERQ